MINTGASDTAASLHRPLHSVDLFFFSGGWFFFSFRVAMRNDLLFFCKRTRGCTCHGAGGLVSKCCINDGLTLRFLSTSDRNSSLVIGHWRSSNSTHLSCFCTTAQHCSHLFLDVPGCYFYFSSFGSRSESEGNSISGIFQRGLKVNLMVLTTRSVIRIETALSVLFPIFFSFEQKIPVVEGPRCRGTQRANMML